MTATNTAETVIQTVRLRCGHHFRYRIGRALAESGFARPGVAWRCAHCETKRAITTVHNAPEDTDT